MPEDRLLTEAIAAIDKGEDARARDLLTRILREEPNRADCWLYLSAVVETDKERGFCLENALKHDPDNETALQGLVMLGKRSQPESVVLARPVSERSDESVKIHKPEREVEEEEKQKNAKKKRKRSPAQQMVPVVIIGIVAVGLVLIGIFGNPFSSQGIFSGPSNPTATFAPFAAAGGPTPTRYVTAVPGTPEPVSDVPLPTPLTISIPEAYTPTPAYVSTPHPDNEAYLSAMRSFEYGEYNQALGLFEQARGQMRDNGEKDLDARYYIGLSYLELGQYEDARREFEKILLEDNIFVAAYTGRARSILSMNPNAKNVAGDLYKAVGIDTEYIDGYLLIAAYRLRDGEADEALRVTDLVLEIEPDHALALHYQAEAYLELELYEEALEAAERSFLLDMTNVDHYFTYAHALIENDRAKEAYGYLELYLREDENKEDHIALYLLGRTHQAHNDHIRALQRFEESYDIRRDTYEMSYYWALSLLAVEEYEDALDRAQVPIEQIIRWFEPYLVKAQAYYYMEDYFEAKEAIEEGADYARTDEQLVELYYWRAVIYDELGYPLIAEDNWTALLELEPAVVPGHYRREALDRIQAPAEPTATPTSAVPTSTRVSDAEPSATPTP